MQSWDEKRKKIWNTSRILKIQYITSSSVLVPLWHNSSLCLSLLIDIYIYFHWLVPLCPRLTDTTLLSSETSKWWILPNLPPSIYPSSLNTHGDNNHSKKIDEDIIRVHDQVNIGLYDDINVFHEFLMSTAAAAATSSSSAFPAKYFRMPFSYPKHDRHHLILFL